MRLSDAQWRHVEIPVWVSGCAPHSLPPLNLGLHSFPEGFRSRSSGEDRLWASELPEAFIKKCRFLLLSSFPTHINSDAVFDVYKPLLYRHQLCYAYLWIHRVRRPCLESGPKPHPSVGKLPFVLPNFVQMLPLPKSLSWHAERVPTIPLCCLWILQVIHWFHCNSIIAKLLMQL